ncbi:MAG: T9SS type A sorting domain-containing protein [Bacteroidota bacterium]
MLVRYPAAHAGVFCRLTAWCVLVFLLFPRLVSAQTGLTFSFANQQITGTAPNTNYQFDVVVQATAAGTRLGDTQVYLNYNTAAFGTSVVAGSKITVTKGTLLQGLLGNIDGLDLYTIVSTTDNTDARVAITMEYNYGGNPTQGNEVPTTATQLLQVEIDISDASQIAGLSFDATLMGNQQYTSNNVDRYSPVVATDTDNMVLPVELVSFAARQEQNVLHFAWATASESNNAGFDLEYKSRLTGTETDDAHVVGDWTQLAYVVGQGTTLERTDYSYEHATLPPGSYLFRLRQIDFDGTVSFGPETAFDVTLPEAYRLDALYPNPMSQTGTLQFAVREPQEVRITLYSLLGQRVATLYEAEVPANQLQQIRVDAGAMASGVYFLAVQGERFRVSERFVVAR